VNQPLGTPLICHIVYRLDFGGLENGLVNLINRMPRERFRHAIIALTESTDFASRIERPDVQIHTLGKQPGKDPGVYWRLLRLLRRMQPAVVHTRNLGTLDCQAVAWAAGVPVRIHGEHGWDVHDPQGLTPRYVRMRRALDRLVHHYVALSGEIEEWLTHSIGIDGNRISRICNGVDTEHFVPASVRKSAGPVTVGAVLRFSDIKDPANVVDGFINLVTAGPPERRVNLLMLGDGPLWSEAQRRAEEAGISHLVELPGSELDGLPWLQRMDVFVRASRREGISNTILEAMACGLPVVATRTGGNPELIQEPDTGYLVPVGDPDALADGLAPLVDDACKRYDAGTRARQRALDCFSLGAMTASYAELYERELRSRN